MSGIVLTVGHVAEVGKGPLWSGVISKIAGGLVTIKPDPDKAEAHTVPTSWVTACYPRPPKEAAA